MKKVLWILLPLSLAVSSMSQDGARPSPVDFIVTERGPHHRVWQRVSAETNALGRVHYRTNSYTELATGMHYLKDGQLVESKAEIVITAEGAAATNGQHKVFFAATLNTTNAVDLTTPDGKRLRSRILGLSYFDLSTSNAVLIAETTNSIGLLVGSNEVLYTNAFDDVQADVQYIYTRAGFAQNIILRAQPPSPGEFGLNPATTRLQVLTEFFDPPTPQKRAVTLSRTNNLTDEQLNFGKMQMVRGKAFPIGDGAATNAVRVAKHWTVIEGRTFLVEEVPFNKVDERIQALSKSKQGASLKPVRQGRGESVMAALKAVLPRPVANTAGGTMALAQADVRRHPGFVLDYEVVTEETYTFRGDTTYLVDDVVNISLPTIEGGTVVKFSTNGLGELNFYDGIDCQTAEYRPAIFTAQSDDSVGEILPDSTGVPTRVTQGVTFFPVDDYEDEVEFPRDNDWLAHVRFSYFQTALSLFFSGTTKAEVRHAQFVDCATALHVDSDCGGGGYLALRNILADLCDRFLEGGLGSEDHEIEDVVRAEHLTVHRCDTLVAADYGAYYLFLTNSLLIAVTDWSYYPEEAYPPSFSIITNHVVKLASDAGVFQTVGAGAHYLANSSTNRDAGTTNINADLLAALRKKTTYPPIILTNTISVSTNLVPQATRDTNGLPDLGYHYDPLDFVCYQVNVTNATLELTPGTAIAVAGDWGIQLLNASELYSEGSPTNMNRIVRPALVQESVLPAWLPTSDPAPSVAMNGQSSGALSWFRFTEWPAIGWQAQFTGSGGGGTGDTATFIDCQFHNGGMDVTPMWNNYTNYVNVTNCLFNRTYLSGTSEHIGGSTTTIHLNVINCTFYQSYYGFDVAAGSTWLQNNAFVETDASGTGSYNGFTPGWSHFGSPYITATVEFQAGPLGQFYQSAGSDFLNAGSATADTFGLFHYTTRTNQVKETNSVVDIGFHYVALTSGAPSDADSDGIPDYADPDSDGNDGLPDWWEQKYFGKLTEVPSGDYDGDCVTNLLEYLQSSNPTDPPVITSAPTYQIVPIGANVTISLGATPGCLNYQWYKDFASIAGATNSSISFTNVQLTNSALYRADASSRVGLVSGTARLAVLDASAWIIWTNFLTHTNGKSINLWADPAPSYNYVYVPPGGSPAMIWNTNCLLYGMTGFTALSPANEWGGEGHIDGGVTALTRRHGYMRGHFQGTCGLRTNHYAGQKVWFYTASNTPVVMTVAADYIRDPFQCAGPDYGLVVFTGDLPDSITPLAVMTPPSSVGVLFSTSQFGYMSVNMNPPAPFICTQFYCETPRPPFNELSTYIGGDSGRPDMIPMPDGTLVFIGGRSTSGPSTNMQSDMDALSLHLGLNTNNYQLNWYTNSP